MMMATITIRGTVWIPVPGGSALRLAPRFLGRIGGSQLPLLASQRRSYRVFRRQQSVEMRTAEPCLMHDVRDVLDGRPAWVGPAWGMVDITMDPSAVPPIYYCCAHLNSSVLSESLVRLGVRNEGRGGALRHGSWRGQRAIR